MRPEVYTDEEGGRGGGVVARSEKMERSLERRRERELESRGERER